MNNKYFYCYSMQLIKFLEEQEVSPDSDWFTDQKTGRKCKKFKQTPELSQALTDYKARNKKFFYCYNGELRHFLEIDNGIAPFSDVEINKSSGRTYKRYEKSKELDKALEAWSSR